METLFIVMGAPSLKEERGDTNGKGESVTSVELDLFLERSHRDMSSEQGNTTPLPL